ncbi:hypothetical protein [Taibaiella chishuiensis]|uniref:Lipopolysaccharide biosynthesis protein n=1 Tax=Taibaiella chishuiensis TaxID=1434707 RepID=A0A2P8DB76_9BACT|nr:hypothetical protein [Taibaiella chishuiensis]PSK94460.1 hypothetical protein B0I18_101616 [Taibaiella chishuiensis]
MEVNKLNNKKILFVTTKYFEYYKDMETVLRDKGASVTTFIDDPYQKYNAEFLSLRAGRKLKPWVIRKYEQGILKKIKGQDFDYIFFVRGSALLSHSFLSALKALYPQTPFLLYEWDSINNFNYLPFTHYFDSVLTFDYKDSTDHRFHYLPLFALMHFFETKDKPMSERKIDFTILGYGRKHRLITGTEIVRQCEAQQRSYLFKLYEPWVWFFVSNFLAEKLSFVKKVMRWSNNFKGITFVSIPKNKWKEILADTRIVVDLPHPAQTGLTIRTFEALASGCHLWTTNVNIKNESFYNPENITIFDAEQFVLPPVPEDNKQSFSGFSLSSWIDNIFKTVK